MSPSRAWAARARQVRGHDRSHRVRDDVRALDSQPLHDRERLVDEQVERERAVDPRGAARAGEVEADRPVAREGRQHGREGVGAAAEPVDHQHGLAVALDLDRHALDEQWLLPGCRGAPRTGLRRESQKEVSDSTLK
jgi:hypothetical protein